MGMLRGLLQLRRDDQLAGPDAAAVPARAPGGDPRPRRRHRDPPGRHRRRQGRSRRCSNTPSSPSARSPVRPTPRWTRRSDLIESAKQVVIYGGEGTRAGTRRGAGALGDAEGAGRLRVPRQGRARARQPRGRRDDRAPRLGRRDRGAREVRPDDHARQRLPVSRVHPGRCDDHPGRRSAASPRPPREDRPRPGRRCRRDPARAAAAAEAEIGLVVPRRRGEEAREGGQEPPHLRRPPGLRRGPSPRDGRRRALASWPSRTPSSRSTPACATCGAPATWR